MPGKPGSFAVLSALVEREVFGKPPGVRTLLLGRAADELLAGDLVAYEPAEPAGYRPISGAGIEQIRWWVQEWRKAQAGRSLQAGFERMQASVEDPPELGLVVTRESIMYGPVAGDDGVCEYWLKVFVRADWPRAPTAEGVPEVGDREVSGRTLGRYLQIIAALMKARGEANKSLDDLSNWPGHWTPLIEKLGVRALGVDTLGEVRDEVFEQYPTVFKRSRGGVKN